MKLHIHIQKEDFDLNDEIDALTGAETGAVATFTGLVRGGDDLTALTLEHYPGMTEREIERIAADSARRWDLQGVTIIHRIGRLTPGERIVLVIAVAAHRSAAFDACHYLMDYLKTTAPFWKQEERGGVAHWVEAKASDADAAERWRRT